MAKPISNKTEQPGEIFFIAFPAPTYKALSDWAAQRGMTFAQALKKALDDFLKAG